MLAMINIPTSVFVAVYVVVISVPILLNLIGAAIGARGAGSSGRRWAAIGCGLLAGSIATLCLLWMVLPCGWAPVLFALMVGSGVSFAVGRVVVRAERNSAQSGVN
jgi:hypothetical protein